MDEFSEHHLKDMLVRGRLKGLVPSAGVGSGFARDAFEEIALAHSQEAFDVKSLTEDYEIGLKFRLAGKKTFFGCYRLLGRQVSEKENSEYRVGWRKTKKRDELIATREYFPDKFGASVRQRSRWILGITLQTWAKVGWKGPLPVLYCLWRDRKALFAYPAVALGYLVAFYCLGRFLHAFFTEASWSFDNVFPAYSVLWYLVIANACIVAWRFLIKFSIVRSIYGVGHGLMAAPRFLVANVISLGATFKAVRQWISHKRTGRPLRWLKTTHAFPTTEALAQLHERLGELLVNREGVDPKEVELGLTLQRDTGLPLGEVLRLIGVINQPQLSRVLSAQFAIPVIQPDPAAIPLSLLAQLPEEDAVRMRVLPVGVNADGSVMVAVSNPLVAKTREVLEQVFGQRVKCGYACPELLERARFRAYRILSGEDALRKGERLGERLLRAGLLSQEQLQEALGEQLETGELLGELLRRRGLVADQDLGSVARGALARSGVRTVDPSDVCSEQFAKIGYALAALHTFVPCLSAESGTVLLAAAYPLPGEILQKISEKTGKPVDYFLASAMDVRVALALGSRSVWPEGIAGGVGGMDGVELAAMARLGCRPEEVSAVAEQARRNARSPVDEVAARSEYGSERVRALRSVILDIPLAPALDNRPSNSNRNSGVRQPSADEVEVVVEQLTPTIARRLAAFNAEQPVRFRLFSEDAASRTRDCESFHQSGVA